MVFLLPSSSEDIEGLVNENSNQVACTKFPNTGYIRLASNHNCTDCIVVMLIKVA
jgi:hypothetical protein